MTRSLSPDQPAIIVEARPLTIEDVDMRRLGEASIILGVLGVLTLAALGDTVGQNTLPLRASDSVSAEPAPARKPISPDARAPRSVSDLLQRFRQSPGVYAEFTEEKYITLLKAPLTSAGQLYYDPKFGLVRRTLSPRPSTMYLTQDKLVLVDGKGRRDVDLSGRGSVQALVYSFLNVLRGDEQVLKRTFLLSFSRPSDNDATRDDPANAWSLTLEPKGAELKRLVRSVRFLGVGAQLTEMYVVETTGDQTTLRLTKLDAQRQFSSQEKQRLFTPPGN